MNSSSEKNAVLPQIFTPALMSGWYWVLQSEMESKRHMSVFNAVFPSVFLFTCRIKKSMRMLHYYVWCL